MIYLDCMFYVSNCPKQTDIQFTHTANNSSKCHVCEAGISKYLEFLADKLVKILILSFSSVC